MLGFNSLSLRPKILPISSPLPILPHINIRFSSSLLKSQTQIPKNQSRFLLSSSGNGNNDLNQEPKNAQEDEKWSNGGGNGSDGGENGLNLRFPSSLLKSETQIPENPSRFLLCSSGNGDNDLNQEPKNAQEDENGFNGGGNGSKGGGNGSDGGENGSNSGGDYKKDRRFIFNIKWSDLLHPDPQNILAVGLTRVLTRSSVHVWQVLLITMTAIHYSFIAASVTLFFVTFGFLFFIFC